MLVLALCRRSMRGLRLAVVPFLLALGMAGAAAACVAVGALGRVAALGVIALWAQCAARLAARRAHAVAEWYRGETVSCGAVAEPAQPVHLPGFLAQCEDPRPSSVRELESARLQFMQAPGRTAREALAVTGLWVLGTVAIGVALGPRLSPWLDVLAGLSALAAAVSLVDLWRGRVRPVRRCWSTRPADAPVPWTIERSRTRVPGPVWMTGLMVLVVAMTLVEAAPDLGAGLNRSAKLAGVLWAVWALRRSSGAVARLEHTALHARLARLMLRLLWPAWWLLAAMQWAAFGLGLTLLWATIVQPALADTGVVMIGLGLMLRLLRNEWPRPHRPAVLAAHEIDAALNGTLLERRLGRTVTALALAALIWAFVQSL